MRLVPIFRPLLPTALAASLIFGACSDPVAPVDVPDADVGAEEVPPIAEAGAKEAAPSNIDADTSAPVPVVTALTPAKTFVGSIPPTLVVTGKDFVRRSVVRVDDVELPTTFISDTQLRATLPGNKLAKAANLLLFVSTPAPGGGVSASQSFAVENLAPSVQAVSPATIALGSPDLPITIFGSDFAAGVSVLFNSTTLAVSASTSTSISTTIPSALLASAGNFKILVKNPGPGGGAADRALDFVVNNPLSIALDSVAPSFGFVGGGDVTIKVKGTGFVTGSTIVFAGSPLATGVSSGSEVTAVIPAARLVSAATFTLFVQNPPPGGGTSAPLLFEVRNPSPAILSLTPKQILYKKDASTSFVLSGSGFIASSVARLGNLNLATQVNSSTSLVAIVPEAAIGSIGSFPLTVVNPTPGGGTSNTISFDVGCNDTSGVDMPITVLGKTSSFSFSFNAADTTYSRVMSSSCPATLLTSTKRPQRGWTVQNQTNQPITLSTWALCSSSTVGGVTTQSDGFLAIYRGSKVPTEDADRKACTGVVSEGEAGGAGDFRSPESNGSRYCPGLTKANGGGIRLDVCERAVVITQPWADPFVTPASNYRPFTTVRIQGE